jgi:release factor glutamine methyltransferase
MADSIGLLLREATVQLAHITETPQLEAEILLAFIIKHPRSYLFSHPEECLSDEAKKMFETFIDRRKQGEPIAYLTSRKEFWSLELKVTPATLVPRPETEQLVEAILNQFTQKKLTLADLGTGTGAIALALAQERPEWKIYATDQSAAALEVAKYNAKQLGIQNVTFLLGNWCLALPPVQFDVIVSNPPYLTVEEGKNLSKELGFEPKDALVSGEEGLDAIQEISVYSLNYLKKSGGSIFIEHGSTQGKAVRKLLRKNGFTNIETDRDLAGLERITKASVSPDSEPRP